MNGRAYTVLVVAIAAGACTARFDPPQGMGPFDGTGGDGLPVPPSFSQSAALHSRVLLGFEYRNAITDLLGESAAAVATPPPDNALNGLTAIGAGELTLTLSQIEAYEKSARAVAEMAMLDPVSRAAVLPCEPLGVDDADCMAAVAGTLGPKMLRHPLSPDEVEGWARLGRAAAAELSSFEAGVQWMLVGLLMDPEFLYLGEVGRPHPSDPAARLLTGHELAARMSFFLTGSTPPDWLLAAAARGELDEGPGISAAAARLLEGPRGEETIGRLMEEVFGAAELDLAPKDSTVFPGWTPALAGSMRQEFRFLVADAVRDPQRDFRTVFDARVAYVDARLAAHYGLPVPANGFERVVLDPAGPRAGLLSMGSFLARHSHPVSSSPTLRGKFVRERLLCSPVNAPPSNVVPSLPKEDPARPRTTRQRHEAHMDIAACSGCHQLMDPLGFAFESFDATGAYRTTENGLVVDASGDLDGQDFDGAAGFGSLLARDPRVSSCLVRTFYRQAVGRVEALGEDPFLQWAQARFEARGGTLKPWLVDLVSSEGFRRGLTPEGAP